MRVETHEHQTSERWHCARRPHAFAQTLGGFFPEYVPEEVKSRMAYRHQGVLGARGTHPVLQGLAAPGRPSAHVVWPWDPSLGTACTGAVGSTAGPWNHGAVAPGMHGLGFLPLLVVI